MIRKYWKAAINIILLAVIFIPPAQATETTASPSGPETTTVSANPKIEKLLQEESKNIAAEFPYRINLFKQGQIDKNSAGVRIAETANQLLSNNSGLLFYYEVVTDAMRVPHWHSNATEIGTVLSGKMRVTIWEGAGNTKMYTVEKNGTWIIPKAKLHSLENVGPEKMKFLVVYDSPIAADRDFLTAWASLPDAILARAVGLTESDIDGIKKTTVNRLSAFDPAASPEKGDMYSELSNNFKTTKPLYQSELGSITRVDSKVNPLIDGMALQRTIMKPGVLRIPHWYTSGDVLLFVLNGEAFFTLMNDDGKVYHTLVHRGDLISIPVGNFHSFLNVGNEDLEVYEGFNRTDGINEITLMNGVQHFNLGTIQGATGLSKDVIKKIQQEKPESYMVKF
ncbi:cupin domain-containing protein [Legionella maceachernii]|uniref:Oxalate decarboxylase OxdC n=1 Tax=Legionella maceachernii TaxID=466 RepID=A0A0W0WG52_9GAMM|nr:cupin domain-containing protein [Legionella maceachernii]KTD31321.1 Oxalate decarboxylase OxdC [Legionella maceachernii]SJZ99759.1 oxalate decarboxylase [Legionella maceachernii]SUP01274.1 Oxalate decarboxylase oxdC [Legionella maceachernii]